MTEQDVGPIDYLALQFPEARLTGEGLGELVDLVDRGIIRVLDLRFVKREADGSYTAIAITDLDGDGVLDLAIFEKASSPACSTTTTSAKRPRSSSRETPLGYCCTRTPGRARSSPRCGEQEPRSSPAEESRPTTCWPC